MKELIFTLSTSEYIKIIARDNIDITEVDYCCSEIQMYFINKQLQLRIGQGDAGESFEHFIRNLKQTINNKLQLHESITQNLGVMKNQYYQNKTGFIKIPTLNGKSSYWVGLNYEISETFNDANPVVTTWMYNNHNGSIILEVTPLYKWHFIEFEDNQKDPDFITYEEFMRNYKPLVQRIIPHDVAVQWLDQAIKVYRMFFSNEEDYTRACKENNW